MITFFSFSEGCPDFRSSLPIVFTFFAIPPSVLLTGISIRSFHVKSPNKIYIYMYRTLNNVHFMGLLLDNTFETNLEYMWCAIDIPTPTLKGLFIDTEQRNHTVIYSRDSNGATWMRYHKCIILFHFTNIRLLPLTPQTNLNKIVVLLN